MLEEKIQQNNSDITPRIINYRTVTKARVKEVVEDLTELQFLPLRKLIMAKNIDDKKKLAFIDVSEADLFAEPTKYVLLGEVNRTSLSQDYIVHNLTELYNAIQKYIITALQKRTEPLEYYLVEVDRLYDLRPFKRLLSKQKPVLQATSV